MRGLIEGDVGLTGVHGELRATWGFAAGLALSPGLSAGGAGRLLTAAVDLGEVDFQNVELDLGYGGLFARFGRPGPFPRTRWQAGLLLGAGNADVRERATRLRLDSDNFFVVEPSLGLDRALRGALRASVTLSYRLVLGVEDLRGVTGEDLRALAVTLGLRVLPL